jgi:hypothetical protein
MQLITVSTTVMIVHHFDEVVHIAREY